MDRKIARVCPGEDSVPKATAAAVPRKGAEQGVAMMEATTPLPTEPQ